MLTIYFQSVLIWFIALMCFIFISRGRVKEFNNGKGLKLSGMVATCLATAAVPIFRLIAIISLLFVLYGKKK